MIGNMINFEAKKKNDYILGLSDLSIYEIYDNCYNEYLEIGKGYLIKDEYLNEIIKRDCDGLRIFDFLKNFDLDENQKRRLLISLLDTQKNIDIEDIKYCLNFVNMDKSLSEKLTYLYISEFIKENENENAENEDDESYTIIFNELYDLLMSSKYVDKDIVLQSYFDYTNINAYLLDIAINIEDVNLLSIVKNYMNNINDVDEIIEFASLIKLNNTDILDKNFINHANSASDYIRYIDININRMNIKILTQNFINIVTKFDDIYKYTQAILNKDECDMSALFLLKNKFISLLENYMRIHCKDITYINFMNLLDSKMNIDELYTIYLTDYCCKEISSIELLINNLDVPEKFIENSKTNKTILDVLFRSFNNEDVYIFLTRYKLFSIENIENKLIENVGKYDFDEILDFIINVQGLNIEKLQNYIIKKSIANDESYPLYLLSKKIKQSNKRLLLDNYMQLRGYFETFVNFVDLVNIDNELLLKIRKYIYNLEFPDVCNENMINKDKNLFYNFLVKYPQIINEDIETKIISTFEDEKVLLDLYKYVDTFSNNYLTKVIKTKDTNSGKICELYFKCHTTKQKDILVSLISTKGFIDDIYHDIFKNTTILTDDEKFDLLIKFDESRDYMIGFLSKFKSNRTIDELEKLVIQNDVSGKLCYVFACCISGANKNKLFKVCIDNNFCYTHYFLKIPNIEIPLGYLDSFDTDELFDMFVNNSRTTIKKQIEDCLINKDKTGKYLYELLKQSKAINDIQIYNILIKKNNLYGLLCKNKFKKFYENLKSESNSKSDITFSVSNNCGLILDNSIVEELITNDELFLRYEKIKFKINKLNNNESIDLVIKNMVQTLNLKKDLLKDELVIKEVITYFDSILIFIDTIIKSNRNSKNYIESNLNEKVANEIRNMSEIIVSSAKEIEESNKFIK